MLNTFQSAIDDLDKTVGTDSALFEYEPVPLKIFLKDKKYLGLPELSKKQYGAVEYATQIYYPETLKELKWKRLRYVTELVLLWGKGSGKDFISRIILLRIAYLLLALRNPQAYFFAKDSACGVEPIHMLNTASSKDQAGNVFFSPLRRYVSKSPFFKGKAQVLASEIRFEKAIFLLSGHSEAEAQEGLSPIAVVLDEIAAFKTEDEVADIKRLRLRKNIPMSAGSLYDFATTSIMTRFPRVGKVILLSFPRFRGDFITARYDDSKDDEKVYRSKGSTFDVNPTKTAKDFEREKRLHPVRYNCRIMCEPSVAEDAFFKNVVALKRAFPLDLPNPVDMASNRFKSWFRCTDGFPRFGHVDLAKNRCRAAFSFVHAYETHRTTTTTDDGKVVNIDLPLIKQDVVMYFTAPPGGEINFEEIRARIVEFTRERMFKISLLTFDGYQSIQMMQALSALGIPVEEQSVDRTREAYETWQDALYEGRFISYHNSILLEEEIPFLIDFKGRKIEHRTGRGKDGSDAVAGAVNNCVKSEAWGGLKFWIKQGEQNAERTLERTAWKND